MKSYCAYTRVSTARQGAHGVSVQEQRRAIVNYASHHRIAVTAWIEEQESASEGKRPLFETLVNRLKNDPDAGLIIHKIDRGARNLRDWATIGELIDSGVDVRFADDGIDVRSRGGRLAADIQAVVAADYVRNLREETIKGFYGRIRQGLLPMAAPIGYQDNGGGKPKTIDPSTGPLIQQAFRLYSNGDLSLQALASEMALRGLLSKAGRTLSPTSISQILRNPFYTGRIRIRGMLYAGTHEPLISQPLFDVTQNLLKARRRRISSRHLFTFRGMITCVCGYALVAERQKGHVYYRCHTMSCSIRCLREELFEQAVLEKVDTTPQSKLIRLAYEQANTVGKRVLLGHLGIKISVRTLVRVALGHVSLTYKTDDQVWLSSLSQILEDIVFSDTRNLDIPHP